MKRFKNRSLVQDESGQGFVEYILLLFIIVSVFLVVSQGLASSGLMKKMMAPINQSFANAYKNGHPEAKGWEDGGPYKHPRGPDGRMFIEVPE